MKPPRRLIYLTLTFIILLLLFMNKYGFFDPRTIQVDTFKITKPLHYQYIGEENSTIHLNENYTGTSIFLKSIFTRQAALYSFQKMTNSKKKYTTLLQHMNTNDTLSISNCNIFYSDENQDVQDLFDDMGIYLQSITILTYPYMIHFSELNKEREEAFIAQVCQGKPIVAHTGRLKFIVDKNTHSTNHQP